MANQGQIDFFQYLCERNLRKSAIMTYYRIRELNFPRWYSGLIRFLSTIELNRVIKQAKHELLGGSPMADTEELSMISITAPLTADILLDFYMKRKVFKLIVGAAILLLSLYNVGWNREAVVEALKSLLDAMRR